MTVISVMTTTVMILLLLMRWSEVISQSTSSDSCCADEVDSPSVLHSLSQLARYQLTAARNIDGLSRDFKQLQTNLQYLQEVPASPTNKSSAYPLLIIYY